MSAGPARSRLVPILQALFVTLLWSTSWVLIKVGLDTIPALTFAGLRYTLAFALLAPLVLASAEHRAALTRLPARGWAMLALLGLVLYTLTQGALFVGLALLPAIVLSLMLSFSPAVVAMLGIPLLGERPSRLQWLGVVVFLAGVLVYFAPVRVALGVAGLAAGAVGLLANSVASVMGRSVNRRGDLHPLPVTVVSMGVGSLALLAAGLATEELPRLELTGWAIVLWLAIVNTAFAFTLWNHTLRRLTAVESSLINNTMLLQIAILAWFFLDEPLGGKEVVGILVAAAGAALVQIRPGRA